MNINGIQCIYCGNIILGKPTKDHIPSKNLFPKGLPIKDPIIILSCLKCNHRFSLDEEYLRIFLVNLSLDRSFAANQLFYGELTRSFQESPSLLKKVASTLRPISLITPSGIDLGEKTAILFSKNDWKRYFNVLDKYAQGLYFHHTKYRYQDKGYKVVHRFLNKPNPEIAKNLKWNFTNREKFMYGWEIVPNTEQAIFYTVFFENIAFLSTIADENFFKEADQRKMLKT